MSGFLELHEEMEREHAAWLDLCKELRARGINVNAPTSNGLVNAVKKWGEELVALRVGQEPELRGRALAESRNDYAGQYERGEYPS